MPAIDFEFALKYAPDVLKGVPATLGIALFAMMLGLIFGLFIALCRIYKVPVLNRIAVVYISFIRGTPLIVQLYVFFYGFPLLVEIINKKQGWNFDTSYISPLIYALIAYTINTSAYQAETFRASINAVSIGQIEAAYSVGMTTTQSFLRIILPQAFLIALPNLGNIFIGLIKATSLAFAVKVVEIMAISKIIANDGYRYLEMYFLAAAVYWVLCFLFEVLFSLLERRLNRHEQVVEGIR